LILEYFRKPGFVGVAGTLLGAIVGAFSSFLIAIYSQRTQAVGRAAVARKNTTYTPLYNELAEVKMLLAENPYPLNFDFEQAPQTARPHPQFTAWERIKRDTRRILVPGYLAKSLEEYTRSVEGYLALRFEAAKDVKDKINEILEETLGTRSTIENIGEVILPSIIFRRNPYYGFDLKQEIGSYFSSGSQESGVNLSPSNVDDLEPKFYWQCHELESVKPLITAYDGSLHKLDELLDSLTNILEMISKKYEHRSWT
jgi:hypothetical protein